MCLQFAVRLNASCEMVAGHTNALVPRTAEVHACLPRGNHATNITEELTAVSCTEPVAADFFVGRRADFLPTLVIATSIVVGCYGTVLLTTLCAKRGETAWKPLFLCSDKGGKRRGQKSKKQK